MSEAEELQNADDLSAFDADPALGAGDLMIGSDADTIKQINKRTSTGGKIVALIIVVALAGLGWYGYQQYVASETAMDVFEPIRVMEDPGQRNAALREVLANSDFEDVTIVAIKNLGHFADAEAVPLIIERLDGSHLVRREAAWALQRIGSPAADAAKPKLLEVLPDCNEVDQNQVVWTLAILNEQSEAFITALIERFTAGGLQELQGFDQRVLTRVLGISRLSSEELTNHESESVRVLTAHALGEVGEDSVVAPLSRMLTNELARTGDEQHAEVIRATAAGLGRTGSAAAARPLFEMLRSHAAMQGTVIDALKKSTAAPSLAVLLGEAQQPEVRRDLVQLIVDSHDRRVLDTLAGLLNDEDLEIKSMAALALAQYGDPRAAPVLFQLTTVEDDDDMVSDAIEALRWVANDQMTDQIAGLLETHAYRKSAILRALGATGDPAAARILTAELEGDDKNSAARGLADLNDDAGFRTLLGKVVRPANTDMTAFNAADRSFATEDLLAIRRAAINAMGYYNRPEAIPELMKVVEDEMDDYELRGAAAAAIGRLGDAEAISTVIGKVGDSSLSEQARRYYVSALWQRPHREINQQLLELIGGSNTEVDIRRASALAVGYSGDPAADERLIAMLDDEGARRHAAVAIALGGGDAASEKLVEWLGRDRDLREILQALVTNSENDWFNLLTTDMFENDAIWRRLGVGQVMKRGDDELSYSYAWLNAVKVLRSGWNGVGGMNPQEVRDKLWEAATGEDELKRRLAMEAFAELPEIGLILRARDEGGELGELAREIMTRGQRRN